MEADHTQISEILEHSHLGAVPDADAYVDKDSDGAVPYVRVGDLTELEVSGARNWIARGRKDTTYAREGAVLFAQQPVPGRVSVAERRVAIHSDIRALKCKRQVHPLYLACSLMARQPELQEFARGRTIPRISKRELLSLEVRVPTAEEQNRRVETARQYSKLKQSQQRGIRLTKSFPQSCFQKSLRQAQSKDVAREVQLTDLLHGMKNGSPVKSIDEESPSAEKVLAVGAEEVATAGVLLPEKCETVEVNGESAGPESLGEDEVVFVGRGNLAGEAAVPLEDSKQGMVPNTSLIRLKVNTEKVEPTYLVHSIMSDRVQSLINRRKSQHSTSRIRQRDLRKMKVPIVPKLIQREFKRRLDSFWPLLRSQRQAARLIEELSDSIIDRFR